MELETPNCVFLACAWVERDRESEVDALKGSAWVIK